MKIVLFARAIVLAVAFAPVAVAASDEAMLDTMSVVVADYFGGRDISESAGQIAEAAPASPVSPEERLEWSRAYIAIALAASLDGQFQTAADLAAAVSSVRTEAEALPDDRIDIALSFVSGSNSLAYGLPLAALRRLETHQERGDGGVWGELVAGTRGLAMSAIGRHGAGITQLDEAEEAVRERLGATHPLAVLVSLWHAEALVAAAHPDAEAAVNDLFDRLGDQLQSMPVLFVSLAALAVGYVAADEIEPVADRAFEAALAALPPDHVLFARALEARAYAAFMRGDYRSQGELLGRVVQIYEQRLAPQSPQLGEALMDLAMAAANLGATEEALEWSAASLRIARDGTGLTSSVTATRMVEAATVHSIADQPEKALTLIRDARRLMGEVGEGDMPAIARIFVPLQEAKALMAARQASEAVEVLKGLLDAVANDPLAGTLVDYTIEADRALALRHANRPASALVSARRALHGFLSYRGRGDGVRSLGGSTTHALRLSTQTLVHSAWRESEGMR